MKRFYEYNLTISLVVILFVICITKNNGCIQEERSGLLELRQLLKSNGEDPSKLLPDWVDDSNTDCCEWERVTCDPTTGHVTELRLSNLKDIQTINGETGLIEDVWSINCSLFLPFSDLRTLDLSFNSFARWDKNNGFEKLSALKKLEIINLNLNNLEDNTIYRSLGLITSLKTLLLVDNQFGDSFPAQDLVGLENLETLDLSYSRYGDWLPKQGFGKLSVFKKLENLNFRSSALTVKVLPYLNSIPSLKVLNLGGNRFGGSFPVQELGNLTNLESLDLSGNYLTGIQGFESLGQFKNLTSLDIRGNKFNRTLFQSLSPLTSLKKLSLSSNSLGDPFPAKELTVLENLEILDLSSNYLSSLTEKDFKLLSKLNKMRHLDLSFNRFEKSVLGILDAIPSLRFLSLASNYLKGPISNQDLTYKLSSLEVLLLNGNSLNGTLPVEGLASLRFLEVLDLKDNYFFGNIPASIERLSSLKVLSLASNQLNGSLTDKGLASLRFLEVLDLKDNSIFGNIPASIETLSSLKVLSLASNQLNGSLPDKGLCELNKLEELDLSDNLLQGTLPPCLRNLNSLKYLNIALNYFTGNLSSSLVSSLSSLEYVGLSHNLFEGLCELKKLEELDLSNNLLQGTLPPCLSNLNSLKYLNIALNYFTGNLSSSLVSSLSSLEYIDLSHNLFKGTFSFSSLANHSKLVVFEINNDNNKLNVETEDTDWFPMFQLKVLVLSNCNLNSLSGNKIPKFLSHQKRLRAVDLSGNDLNDLLPTWLLVNNTGLDVLKLQSNSLFGTFHLPSLHNTATLDFSDNHLNGTIQANIGNMLPFISYLNLSNNAFEGDIPSSFGVTRQLSTLDLSSNILSGEPPMESFGNCTLLMSLLLSNNSLHGEIFTANFNLTTVQILQLANNQFTGPLVTSVFLQLSNFWGVFMYLDVSNNYFSGEVLGLRDGSDKFTPWGTVILRNNSFVGEFPCSLVPTEFMDVSYNSFSGPISNCSNQNLAILKHLHLQGNKFTGLIPQSFLNSSVLLTLDISENRFSGTIPMFLTPLSELRILLSRGNLLNGSIPSHLCQLNKISLLDISNNFFTGSIPPCLSNITFGMISGYDPAFVEHPISTRFDRSLYYYRRTTYDFQTHGESITYSKREEVNFVTKSRLHSYQGNLLNYMSGLDLSGNKLTGEIPMELGELSAIHVLNLSHNHLIGSIPKSFSNLKQVESLDLSYNSLSGSIPMELTSLYFLSVFSVADNNLSGEIPYGKEQFSTFNASSYEGNSRLCGPPLGKSCDDIDTRDTPTDVSGERDGEWLGDDRVVIYAIFGSAYVTFLIGTLVVLCINSRWRKWWFDLIDRGLDSCYLCFVINRKNKLR